MNNNFYIEALDNKCVYTIKDSQGFPAPKNSENKRVQPFWSTEIKAKQAIKNNKEYVKFEVHRIEINKFLDNWLTGLAKDKIKIGINWVGKSITGYDLSANEVFNNFKKIT